MHICAHQITSLAVLQRAGPVAQGRDLIVKSSAQFLEVVFFHIFYLHNMNSKFNFVQEIKLQYIQKKK